MQITIFAKNRTSKDGKKFQTYFGKLTKKDGEEITTQVKFKEECGTPKVFPCNIVVDKTDCNFVEKGVKYTDKEGNEKDAIDRTLWVSAWAEGEEYVDHSMDSFVD